MSETATGEQIISGIVQADRLQQFVDTVGALVYEAKVHFGEHGLRVAAVEPSNVAMWRNVTLERSAFESFEAPGQVVIGVDIGTLDDRLGPANAGDLVHLTIDMETRTLRIEYRNITQSVALIDPDNIRDGPDDPDLDLDNELVITGGQFSEAIDVADMVSDHVKIDGRPDDREVVFVAEGDIDDNTVAFGDEESIDASVDTAGYSLFSVGFMADFASVMPTDAEITIRFDDEFPATFEWEAADGRLTVEAACAPRIEID